MGTVNCCLKDHLMQSREDKFKKDLFWFLESFTSGGINEEYIDKLLKIAEEEAQGNGDRAMIKAYNVRYEFDSIRRERERAKDGN